MEENMKEDKKKAGNKSKKEEGETMRRRLWRESRVWGGKEEYEGWGRKE